MKELCLLLFYIFCSAIMFHCSHWRMHWTFPCSYPVDFQVKEPEELVTKRCIDGALSILKTWLNSKTVKRVVYTTSVGAVICNGKEDQVMDESFWSDVVYLRSSEILKWSYAVSKALTERMQSCTESCIWYVMQFACPVFYHLLC